LDNGIPELGLLNSAATVGPECLTDIAPGKLPGHPGTRVSSLPISCFYFRGKVNFPRGYVEKYPMLYGVSR